jgi:GT2 family glycosyltransferase
LRHLGIIIVHFGEVPRTINCLCSLAKAIQKLKSSYPVLVSVLIVDNSGNLSLEDDGSLGDFEVRCLNSEKNLGYAGACYIGAKLLRDSSLLLFSNNDVVFSEDSLVQLLRTLDSLPEVGAVQPLVLTKNSSRVDSAGLTCNGIMHVFNYSNWPISPPNKCFTTNGVKVIECFGIDGVAFVIKKKVWDEVGGWDPTFFMFNEDALLSWKLRLKGYKNYVALSSIIYHERGGTAEGYFTKKEPMFPSYYISRNKILSVL